MKLKIPLSHYAITANMLGQFTIDNPNINQVNFALFKELRTEFLKVCARYMGAYNTEKEIVKTIPDSQALLFFENFNGIELDGFTKVVIQNICIQIEEELFKTDKYSLILNFRPKP
jgi:hypothetical protein